MKNLIGVSGRMGSGKDTVGTIIQYLQEEDDWNSFNDFVANSYPTVNEWVIRKYADKLKDMVCLLIGCTREQLEDQDFKNTVLPEIWDKYAVEINDKVKFIGTQEDANKVFEHYVLDLRINSGHIQVKKMHLTPRLILQWLGTDCGRDIIHENIWVNSLFADYKPAIYEASEMSIKEGKTPFEEIYPKWIITDMRFENELNGIKDRGGITIRVNRTGIHTPKIEDLHPSETALDDAEFDYYIDNSGTVGDLIEKVREILIKEKIL